MLTERYDSVSTTEEITERNHKQTTKKCSTAAQD